MNAKTLSRPYMILGMALFLAAGCSPSTPSDTSEPQSTVKTALSAIQDDRLEDFRATLSAELLKKIGDEPSLLKLRSTLAAQQQVSLGDEMKINEIVDPYSEDERRVVSQDFTEQVLGRGNSKTFNLLYLATVHCELHTQEMNRVKQSGAGTPAKQTQEVKVCQITQLDQ